MKNTVFGQNELKMLKIILGVLIAAIIILAVTLAITQTNRLSSDNRKITIAYAYRAADHGLFPFNQDEKLFYAIGIVSNKQELTSIVEKYSYTDDYYQEHQDEFYHNKKAGDHQRPQDIFYNKFNDEDFVANNYLTLSYTDGWCTGGELDYIGLDDNGDNIVINLTYEHGKGLCSATGILLFIEVPKKITNLDQVLYNISRL